MLIDRCYCTAMVLLGGCTSLTWSAQANQQQQQPELQLQGEEDGVFGLDVAGENNRYDDQQQKPHRYLKHRKKKIRPNHYMVDTRTSSTIQTRKYAGEVTTNLEMGNRPTGTVADADDAYANDTMVVTNSHKKRSDAPSSSPSFSHLPSDAPTGIPSYQPSNIPSVMPSSKPTDQPSAAPSSSPSTLPSTKPSNSPSSMPSSLPSKLPSTSPTDIPTFLPSSRPTSIPSGKPSTSPSKVPSPTPTSKPSKTPSISPTSKPSANPSIEPTVTHSGSPSDVPSAAPSACSALLNTFTCTTSDCTILYDLFIATNGCSWNVKTNWLLDDDYCTWQGVTCTIMYGVDEITEINLAGNNLSGTIPSTIGGLFYLSQMVLSTNKLYGEIPSNLGTLVNLNVLNIINNAYDNFSNPLTGIIPQELCDNIDTNGGSLQVLSADCDTPIGRVDCEANGGCCTFCTKSSPSGTPTLNPNSTPSPTTKAPSANFPSVAPTPVCSSTPPTSFTCDGYNLKTTCLQLVEFYEATNGCEWVYGSAEDKSSDARKLQSTNDAWFSGTPVTNALDPFCSWHGVSCQNHDCTVACDVTKIDLPFNNLRGTLPNTMFLLPEIVSLELNGNYLTGTIPTEFGWLNHLQVLVLDQNMLTGTYKYGVPGVCDLVDLDILILFFADCDDNYEVECDCCTSCGEMLAPSEFPSDSPTLVPSFRPSITMMPSLIPTQKPSSAPSAIPTPIHSSAPSSTPSVSPSDLPSTLPSDSPSQLPSVHPSDIPSKNPSGSPSSKPSPSPSTSPSVSFLPTQVPSDRPSLDPTSYCYEPADYRCSNNDASVSFPLGAQLRCPDSQNEVCNVLSCGGGISPPSDVCCVCKGFPIAGNIYPSASPS